MKFNSWFVLATNAKNTPTNAIIAAMATLPVRPHLKYIRVLYEKIRSRGLTKNNIFDLMSIIRNHLKTRNIKAIEADLCTPNHWTESVKDLMRHTETEKQFIDALLKNVRVEYVLKAGDASLLQIWGYLGAVDRLAELKAQYSFLFKSKDILIDFINANLIASGLQGDLKTMGMAYDYYQLSRLPAADQIQLDYCKFLILNNRNNMIPGIINSKKYSNDQLYHNLVLPLFARCPPSIFLLHMDKISSHIKKKLLGESRIRLLVLKSYILEKKIKKILYLVKSTQPEILNQHPDILEGLYHGTKSILEKRNDYLNQEEKMKAFKSIPSIQPKCIEELYPMIDMCFSDLEAELVKCRIDGSSQNAVHFKNQRRLLMSYLDWAEHFLNTKSYKFVPNQEDFLLIINALLEASLSLEEVEKALVEMIDINSHFKMEIPDETILKINCFFNTAKYLPVKWKIKLSKLEDSEDRVVVNKIDGVVVIKKKNSLKASNVSQFRHLVEKKQVDEANDIALKLIEQGYQFSTSAEHFIMLVNMNISGEKFDKLKILFREYLKPLNKFGQNDSFYISTLFSMIQRKLYVQTAELIEEIAATIGILPDQGVIQDIIFHIAQLPQISHELLHGAIRVFSFLPPEKLDRKLVEEMIYIAYSANKDLNLASHVFNLALEGNIKLGNWCYQQILHIFAAHQSKELILKVIAVYSNLGGNIMPINIAFEHFVSHKDLDGMKQVLRLVRKSSLELDALSYKWILQGFAFMDSNMQSAEALWRSIKENAFSYSDTPYKIMILGYSRMRTAEADEKMVDMTNDWLQKKNANVNLNLVEDVVSFMIFEGFIDCADYFLETMRINFKDLTNAETEYMLLKGYLETGNVSMVLQSFHRILDCIEYQSDKMAVYESLVHGLQRIGQSELADKYRKQGLSQNDGGSF